MKTPATCRPRTFLGIVFSLPVRRLCQPVDERLRNRGSRRAAVDYLAVSDVLAVERFVPGLIALERCAVEGKAGEDSLGLAVEHDLSVRIFMGALSIAPRGGCI